MNPLVDEIIVLTLLRSVPEYLQSNIYVHARQEAYGPSRNEGLCYESCYGVGFEGDLDGVLYFGMDGYTKPEATAARRSTLPGRCGREGMADSVLMEFSNQMTSMIIRELEAGGFSLNLGVPENFSHRIVTIDKDIYRQYILIFFLRDRRERSYLGRAYFVLTIKKY